MRHDKQALTILKTVNIHSKEVTFLISSLAGGGAEGVCVNVTNGLAERGFRVELVLLNMDHSVYHEKLNDKVNLTVLDVTHIRYSLVPLIKYFRKAESEKVIVFGPELTVMALIARYFCKNKFKVIARNLVALSQMRAHEKSSLYQKVVNKLIDVFYKKADFIINQSVAMRDDLQHVYPEIKNKTTVIQNPVRSDIERFSESLNFKNIEKDNYVLCIGRLEDEKAFHLAIEAFSTVARDFPDIRLKIVGQGTLESSLKKLVHELNRESIVDFEGFQKNVIPYYLKAKLVLLTSLYEGLPNVLIESISLGTPVVSFDCTSGPKEIIIDGVNGYLVEYLNTKDLRDKICLALHRDWNYRAVHETSLGFRMKQIIHDWEDVIRMYP